MGSWYLLKICLDLCETLTAMLEAAFMKLNHWDLDIAMKLSHLLYLKTCSVTECVCLCWMFEHSFCSLQALFVPRIQTDAVKLTKRAMVLWFYHLKRSALISFDQLTQSTWSCLPRREQNTPRSPESGAKFIFSMCSSQNCSVLYRFVGGKETEKSSHRLRMPEKNKLPYVYMDHYGSNPLETEVYKVYSVYSHPWAQRHMARESADPVHGAMVLMEWQGFSVYK